MLNYVAKNHWNIDTENEANEYLERRRCILPAIYNQNIQKYNWNPPRTDERTCNETVHVKLEQEVERLRNEIHLLQNQMGVDDMDQDEIEDVQRILLDSDDEDVDLVLDMPAPISVKQENHTTYNDDGIDFGSTNIDNEQHDETSTQSQASQQVNDNASTSTDGTTTGSAVVSSSQNTGAMPVNSIFDPVAGYINVVTNVSNLMIKFQSD